VSDPEIAIAFAGAARVGEGPVWDVESRTLHWVDILAGEIHTSEASARAHRTITLPTLVGAAAPRRSGGFVAATREGFAAVEDDGPWTTRVANLGDGLRMNDAKCDPNGRFWSGSTDMQFAAGRGALHVLGTDWRCETVLDDLTLPNGLGWSPDGSVFYLIDTIAAELNAFDVSTEALEPLNRRVLARFPASVGQPDGMTVDAHGCLWIAMWGGGRLIRVSPSGDTLFELPLPVDQPSSCTFGGPDLDVLYVTSAREGLDVADSDPAGSVFAIRDLGVRGLPTPRFEG
jgi:sugar lactone lactonase YvrE